MLERSIKDFFPEVDTDVRVVILTEGEYSTLMNELYEDAFDVRAMAVVSPISMILLNIDAIEESILNIVVAHEYGHIVSGVCEERADRVALTLLSEEDKTLLKSNWNNRHGHHFFA